jgi:hypothetical protein
MKIDDNKLEAVFLRPRQEQNNLTGKAKQPEAFEAFLANDTASQTKKDTPLDLASADLLAASFIGKLKTQQALSLESLEQTLSISPEEEIGGVLDSLEEYIKALGDPQLTLKEIAPLAEDLSRGAFRLDKLAAGLAQEDPLKDLTNETAALAAVEAIKFKRGDFV